MNARPEAVSPEDAPADPLHAARWAIAYTLTRIRHDPALHWVMLGSETQRRLCIAFAALSGMPLDYIEECVRTTHFDRASVVEDAPCSCTPHPKAS